ncbi:MAG: hypothetical protein PUE64_01765 [Firmicutes bacterium]|nr:hypothetical protein [Bacillota bacterium]
MKTREEQLNRILQEAVDKAGKAEDIIDTQQMNAWSRGLMCTPEIRVLVIYQPDMTDNTIDFSKVKVTCGTRKQLLARGVFLQKNIIGVIKISDVGCYWHGKRYQMNDTWISDSVNRDIESSLPAYTGLEPLDANRYLAWLNRLDLRTVLA